MDVKDAIISQYGAALEMLRQAIEVCPDTLWQAASAGTPFWQVAYHALFLTDMYSQESEQAFRPWVGHREASRVEEEQQTPPEPAPKATVRVYLDHCRAQLPANVAARRLDAPSGFDWIALSTFELQMYAIRHIQQHTGELMERLGPLAGELTWVGTQPR